jgi:hypothetical protein
MASPSFSQQQQSKLYSMIPAQQTTRHLCIWLCTPVKYTVNKSNHISYTSCDSLSVARLVNRYFAVLLVVSIVRFIYNSSMKTDVKQHQLTHISYAVSCAGNLGSAGTCQAPIFLLVRRHACVFVTPGQRPAVKHAHAAADASAEPQRDLKKTADAFALRGIGFLGFRQVGIESGPQGCDQTCNLWELGPNLIG